MVRYFLQGTCGAYAQRLGRVLMDSGSFALPLETLTERTTMSTQTKTPIENITPAENAAERNKAAQANANAEATAFAGTVSEANNQASKLGALAIDALAVAFGKSCSVAGRPTVSAWFALVAAMAGQENLTHERRTDIVRKALAAHKAVHGENLKFKACAAQKAKASLGKGSASYSLNMPVAVSVAAE